METVRDTENLREFATGATRDTSAGKPSYLGYLSPMVLERFGAYMLHHQKQSDGSMRGPDNWKKGMPYHVFMDSLLRHFMDVWSDLEHSRVFGGNGYLDEVEREDALCAIIFNAQGALFELLNERFEPGSLG